jgi:hypothetical protein
MAHCKAVINKNKTDPNIRPSQLRIPTLDIRKNPRKSGNRGREKVLPAPRDDERTSSVQRYRLLRISRKNPGSGHLLVLTQLTQNCIKTHVWPDKVSLVGPLALNESEAFADGALIANEEQPAFATGVDHELVALC